jgi:CubicO group peptidase (beta-lactamase class C family)
VEKILGESYGDFLQKTFFDGLDMTNTGAHTRKKKLDHEALGYQFEQGKYSKALIGTCSGPVAPARSIPPSRTNTDRTKESLREGVETIQSRRGFYSCQNRRE